MYQIYRKCRFCGRVRMVALSDSLPEATTEQGDGRKSDLVQRQVTVVGESGLF